MGTAPRPWQRSLSNLSVTSKVGIVLLLPVLLASTFAVLRIRDELGRIAQLDTASEQARIIRPTLAFATAADALAVAAGGERVTDAALDQASTRYDQTSAELQSTVKSTASDERVTTELTQALEAGRNLRNNPRANTPATIVQQADEVARHVDTALTALPTPQDARIQHYFDQLGAVAAARRQFIQQQLLIGGGEIGGNPAALARVLNAGGAEQTMINQYATIQPDSAVKPDVLLNALQTRLAALSQNAVEPIAVPGVADSMRISTDTYNEATEQLAARIDSSLSRQSIDARTTVLRDVALVVVTLLVGLALALAVARSLVVPVRRLRRDALQVAHIDLPDELAVVREGGATPEIVPVDVHTTEEIGQLARAVDDMHRQALYLAADQARLRLQIGNMFETLSRRSQSLVEQQLALIEDLERDEDDSERLQSLFRLDHLATRMRRNGDNLLVLAGTALRRGMLPPTPLSDMLWSAVSQVEDYQRVEIGTVPDGMVAGEPAVDIEHLLAELIDNSLRYSPPNTPVAVSVTRATDGGYLIEITDRGLGMSPEDLRAINDRLASGGEVTIETARRMGLFVVGRLAKRHSVTVSLRRTASAGQQAGVTASVHLPSSLVAASPEHGTGPQVIAPFPSPSGPEETGLFARTETGLPQRRPGEAADFGAAAAAERPESRFPDGLFTHRDTGELFTHRESALTGGFSAPAESEQATPPATDFFAEPDPADLPRTEYFPRQDPEQTQAAGAFPWPSGESGDDPTTRPESVVARGDAPERPDFFTRRGQDSTASGDRENSAFLGTFGRRDTGAAGAFSAAFGRAEQPRPESDRTPDPFGRPEQPESESPRTPDTFGRPEQTPAENRFARGDDDMFGQQDPHPPRPEDAFGQRDTRASRADDAFGQRDTRADNPFGRRDTPPAEAGDAARAEAATPEAGDLGRGETEADTGGFGRAQTGTSKADNLFGPGEDALGKWAGGDDSVGGDSPIYQRMVSEWLVEPSSSGPASVWSTPADAGWAAAAEASAPTPAQRTEGGLPIRRPGAQLVPGGLDTTPKSGAPDPEEIRTNLTRHLSGVRSGRAEAQHNDGGPA